LLATVQGSEPCGCVALKALETPGDCEMKRLYVRPHARSLGVGRMLVERIVTEAKCAGYERMRLDTLPSMVAAQRLYRAAGFHEIAAYCENPVPGAVYLEFDLGARR
jgi:ribosomal protein S18 acetylase RimI-like enzyme